MVHASLPRTARKSPYGLPTTERLRRPEIADDVMTKMIAYDAGIEKFHHEMVRNGIATKFAYALILRSDPKAFEAWSRRPRVLGISKPVKDANDALRALMAATIPDPKKASKYWKRVEGLWIEGKLASDVVPFLERYKLQGLMPGKTIRKRVRPPEDVVDADVDDSHKTTPVRRLDAVPTRDTVIKTQQETPSPKGVFAVVHRVPSNDWAEIGARVQFGGTVHAIDGDELTIAVTHLRPATRAKT